MTTPKSKAAKPAVDFTEAYQGGLEKSKETIEAAIKASSEAAAKAFGFNRERFETMVKSYDDFAGYGKETFEAFVTAGNVATKGVEAINAEMLAYSKSSLEDSLAAAKAAMSAKSLQELIELQSDFAKTYMDQFMHQSTKVGELAAKLAQEAFEPINAQVQAAVEKFVKPLAA